MPDYVARVIRTLLQMVAGGAFAAVFAALVDMTDLRYQTIVAAVFSILVTFAQNYLEDTGRIPALLKPADAAGAEVEPPHVL